MSKQKMLQVIYERTFEHLQKLSIATYKTTIQNKEFDFESYFETSYKSIIEYSLEYLKTDCEKYKNIFYKYFKEMFDLSVNSAHSFMSVGTSVRVEIFNWWKDNWKEFLKEIMNEYSI